MYKETIDIDDTLEFPVVVENSAEGVTWAFLLNPRTMAILDATAQRLGLSGKTDTEALHSRIVALGHLIVEHSPTAEVLRIN